jgi:hypothetical protein
VVAALLLQFVYSPAFVTHELPQRKKGESISWFAELRHFELLRRTMVIRCFEGDGSSEHGLYEEATKSGPRIAIRVSVMESMTQEKVGSSSASVRSGDARMRSVEV